MLRHIVLGLVAPSFIVFCSSAALAQTVSASGAVYPDRLVGGKNLGSSTRAINLDPFGVSYADCASDMTLQFSVTLSGFAGNSSLQVWGSPTSDCTAQTDRGIGTKSAVCWGLTSGITDPVINTPQTYTFNVRVQDLVGWQQSPPSPQQAASPPPQGMAACSAQATPAAVPININFLAIDGDGNLQGTPFQYNITTDLVGPPAPAGVQLATIGPDFLATWIPNNDHDTVGYDVFFASAPSPDGQAGCAAPPLSNPLGVVEGGASGLTVSDAEVGSYQFGPAVLDTQGALVVAAVDGTGNVGATSGWACDDVEHLDEGASGGSGISCSIAAPAESGAELLPCLVLLALAWARRTRQSDPGRWRVACRSTR